MTDFFPNCVGCGREVSNRDINGIARADKFREMDDGYVQKPERRAGRERAVKLSQKMTQRSTDMMRLQELFATTNMAEGRLIPMNSFQKRHHCV